MSERPGPRDRIQMEVLDSGNDPEGPSRWRPSALAVWVLLGVLVAGLGVGFAVGRHRHASQATLSALSKPEPARPGYPIAATGNTCSEQVGSRLELGVEVLNPSSATLILNRLSLVLPRRGLRVEASSVGTCGQVTEAPAFGIARLRAGASTWVTMTFDVIDHCPSALPVELSLAYSRGGHHETTALAEFPNLTYVPYSRCPPVPRVLPDR